MIVVIFEVTPKTDKKDEYLAIAADLKQYLSAFEGFISIERFQSLTDPAHILSLSFWEDEASVAAWRNHMTHREAQGKGRNNVFEDYRIRVAEIIRDYGMNDREQAPG